jgi:hypothetical protein
MIITHTASVNAVGHPGSHTVGETKDSLKSAAGYKYDSSTTTWSPDGK